MGHTSHLHHTIVRLLLKRAGKMDFRNLQTLGWMICGLIMQKTVSLCSWSVCIKCRALLAASSVRRFSRWLHNPAIDARSFYSPMVREMLRDWSLKMPLYLALDTSMLWDRYCCIRLSLICMNRAVPIAWDVLEHDSSSVSFETYKPVLESARALLPEGARVVFLADRGFCHWDLMAWLHSIGWHWRIRGKKSLKFRSNRNGSGRFRKVHLKQGEARIWRSILVNCKESFPLALAAGASTGKDEEPWLILTDEPLMGQAFQDYARRFCIEESFLDEKSGGFQLEESLIRNAEALERLLLVTSIATMYLVIQGVEVEVAGNRRIVDPHWNRGMSYLKIGWNWILRFLSGTLKQSATLIHDIHLPCVEDPEPAIASKKQAQRQKEKSHIFYKFARIAFAD